MTKNKRILVISDSLALPRSKPEQTLYEDTYPYMLRKDYEVFQLSFGGGTIKEIVHQANYYLSYNPDYVILQSGIVDCAYRAFPLFVDKGAVYSGLLDLYRRVLARVIPPRILRRVFRFRYTNPQDFEASIITFKEMFPNARILAIGIIPASKEYVELVHDIDKSISQYNAILERNIATGFINLSNMPEKAVMSDHHHLNKFGHQFTFNKIQDIIKQDD